MADININVKYGTQVSRTVTCLPDSNVTYIDHNVGLLTSWDGNTTLTMFLKLNLNEEDVGKKLVMALDAPFTVHDASNIIRYLDWDGQIKKQWSGSNKIYLPIHYGGDVTCWCKMTFRHESGNFNTTFKVDIVK
jgi:hypothetical protein